MNPSRVLLLVVAGCCLLRPEPLAAQAVSSPFSPAQQYSADQIITTKDGHTITDKIYLDNGKIRTEMTNNGMQIISIVRPDQQKMYSVMVDQKMVMEMPLDPEKMKRYMPPVSSADGKFETVGPETVEGVACTKYKITNKDNKVFFMWVDAATKAPVKMSPEDGSMTMVWKNYQTGPQDPALFEPPVGYQVMNLPSMPNMPGGAGMPGGH